MVDPGVLVKIYYENIRVEGGSKCLLGNRASFGKGTFFETSTSIYSIYFHGCVIGRVPILVAIYSCFFPGHAPN